MPVAGEPHPVPWGRIALAWLGLAALLVLVNLGHISAWRFTDPDDTLRLVQVRDLYAGQGWFDLHQYRINPGDSPVEHWSRLVDLPLLAVIALLTPLFGQALAEGVAVVLVPMVTLGIVMAAVGRIAFRLFGSEVAMFACLAVGLSSALLGVLQPMRIDHHGWQVAMVMLAIGTLLGRKPKIGGALAGLAFAIGLTISLEVLPLAAALGAVLLIRWLRDPAQRWWLASFLASFAFVLALLFLLTRGPSDLVLHCDAVSPAHLGFFALAAIGACIAAAMPRLPRVAALGVIAVGGVAGLALFLTASPECVSGPFGSLDPLVREYWYDFVLEGRPFWRQPPAQSLAAIAQGLVALGVTFHLWREAESERRGWWLDYLLLLAASLLGGMLVWRSMSFVGALSALPLGWLAHRLLLRLRRTERPLAKLGVAFGGMALLMPAVPVALALAVLPVESGVAQGTKVRMSSCELRENAPLLDRFAPATIFAPIDLGPSLLERTHHSVVATGHHRANLAMRDVILAFISPPTEAEAVVKQHKAGYIVICTDLGEPRIYAKAAPDGLMAQLLAGHAPEWLEPVALDTPESFKVWEVRE